MENLFIIFFVVFDDMLQNTHIAAEELRFDISLFLYICLVSLTIWD
jgi:hypothetical protein